MIPMKSKEAITLNGHKISVQMSIWSLGGSMMNT